MQGRHWSPVDRMRPDRPMQGHGTYGSGYRNFNRGGKFRRGPPKSHSQSHFPPPQLPPPPVPINKIDIFKEAGRLAAEYLVSKGMLPPSSLPPRLTSNGSFKEFRGRDRENYGIEGRGSALDRLGSSNMDVDSDVRRYNDDYGRAGPWQRGRRRRMGNNGRAYGSDWGRENERNASWMDRSRSFNENMRDDDDDVGPGYWHNGHDEVGDGRASKAVVDADQVSDNYDQTDDTISRGSSSGTRRESPPRIDMKLNRGTDSSVNASNNEIREEVKDGKYSSESEEKVKDEMEGNSAEQAKATEDDTAEKQTSNLLKLCSFVKVPTKPRSSMECRSSKVVQSPVAVEVKKSDEVSTVEKENADEVVVADSEAFEEKNDIQGSTLNSYPQDSVPITPENPVVLSIKSTEGEANQNAPTSTESKTNTMPISFPDNTCQQHVEQPMPATVFAPEDKICAGTYTYSESSSAVNNHNSPLSEISGVGTSARVQTHDGDGVTGDKIEGKKRPRDWYCSMIPQDDDYLHLPKKISPNVEMTLGEEEIVEAVDQKKISDTTLFPKMEAKSYVELEEEKQLIPSSFKICDLNLMGTPEITEIPDNDVSERVPDPAARLIETGKAPSVDFGLSIGRKGSKNGAYAQRMSGGKAVEVIDLEDDSQVQSGGDSSKPKTEAMYSNLESFLNHPEGTVDLPIQDGYNLSLSDMLGADMSSCPPVSADMDNLQPEMGIPGADVVPPYQQNGIAGDDDSIYVSLGEIPIGFMDVWDQSPQEYGKFF